VPPPEYFPIVREICSRYDVLFIADEILTGFGRTGRHFAVNHWTVVPDVITMGKGISGGYAPLGAVAVSQKIRAVFEEKGVPFDNIFTHVANPISTTAASEVLKIWQEENLTDRAAQVGEYLMRQLAGLKEHAIVGDVRGLGLMVAIEFVRDRATKEPFPVEKQVAKLVGKLALQNGLVTYPGTGMVDGQRGDVVSLFPPLIFTSQHVDELVAKLDATLTQVEQVI